MEQSKKLLGWLALFSWFLAAGAFAQEKDPEPNRMLILNPESKFLSPAKLSELAQHLRSVAGQYPNLTLVGDPVLTAAELRKRANCTGSGADCLAKMGAVFEANRVVHCEIQKLPGRLLVVMTQVDAVSGALIGQSRQRVRGGEKGLKNAILKGWVELAGPLVRSQLKVYANVIGAEVLLDGSRIGQTPLILTKDLSDGPHMIQVSRQGYEPVRQEVRMEAGRDVRLEVTLRQQLPANQPSPAGTGAPAVGQKLGGEKLEGKPMAVRPALFPPTKGVPKEGGQAAAGRPNLAGLPKVGEPAVPYLPDTQVPAGEEEGGEAGQKVGAPFYQKWWFWTAVGLVVAGGTAGSIVLLSGEGGIPAGKGRIVIDF